MSDTGHVHGRQLLTVPALALALALASCTAQQRDDAVSPTRVSATPEFPNHGSDGDIQLNLEIPAAPLPQTAGVTGTVYAVIWTSSLNASERPLELAGTLHGPYAAGSSHTIGMSQAQANYDENETSFCTVVQLLSSNDASATLVDCNDETYTVVPGGAGTPAGEPDTINVTPVFQGDGTANLIVTCDRPAARRGTDSFFLKIWGVSIPAGTTDVPVSISTPPALTTPATVEFPMQATATGVAVDTSLPNYGVYVELWNDSGTRPTFFGSSTQIFGMPLGGGNSGLGGFISKGNHVQ